MPEAYIPGSLESVIDRAVDQFPAVVVIGPGQSGKTTLLPNLYGTRFRIISLEPDVRAAAASDPRGFLELYPPPIIHDKVQYAPGLLP
jgi:uncharacterized protein